MDGMTLARELLINWGTIYKELSMQARVLEGLSTVGMNNFDACLVRGRARLRELNKGEYSSDVVVIYYC